MYKKVMFLICCAILGSNISVYAMHNEPHVQVHIQQAQKLPYSTGTKIALSVVGVLVVSYGLFHEVQVQGHTFKDKNGQYYLWKNLGLEGLPWIAAILSGRKVRSS
jgi:hypothetical protein